MPISCTGLCVFGGNSLLLSSQYATPLPTLTLRGDEPTNYSAIVLDPSSPVTLQTGATLALTYVTITNAVLSMDKEQASTGQQMNSTNSPETSLLNMQGIDLQGSAELIIQHSTVNMNCSSWLMVQLYFCNKSILTSSGLQSGGFGVQVRDTSMWVSNVTIGAVTLIHVALLPVPSLCSSSPSQLPASCSSDSVVAPTSNDSVGQKVGPPLQVSPLSGSSTVDGLPSSANIGTGSSEGQGVSGLAVNSSSSNDGGSGSSSSVQLQMAIAISAGVVSVSGVVLFLFVAKRISKHRHNQEVAVVVTAIPATVAAPDDAPHTAADRSNGTKNRESSSDSKHDKDDTNSGGEGNFAVDNSHRVHIHIEENNVTGSAAATTPPSLATAGSAAATTPPSLATAPIDMRQRAEAPKIMINNNGVNVANVSAGGGSSSARTDVSNGITVVKITSMRRDLRRQLGELREELGPCAYLPAAAAADIMNAADGRSDITNSKWEAKQLIGRGGYGSVYKGTWRGLEVAIKRVIFQVLEGEEGEERRLATLQEAVINESVHHPNLISTYCTEMLPLRDISNKMAALQGVLDWQMHIIMEYCEGGSLRTAVRDGSLRKEKSRSLQLLLILQILRQMAAAFIYLHAHNIIHGDLKPDNVLFKSALLTDDSYDRHNPLCPVSAPDGSASGHQVVAATSFSKRPGCEPIYHHRQLTDAATAACSAGLAASGIKLPTLKEGLVKIVDFGLSKSIHGNMTHVSGIKQGTPLYAAPEILREARTSKAADVYSFGVIMWELYHNTLAYYQYATLAQSMASDVTASRNVSSSGDENKKTSTGGVNTEMSDTAASASPVPPVPAVPLPDNGQLPCIHDGRGIAVDGRLFTLQSKLFPYTGATAGLGGNNLDMTSLRTNAHGVEEAEILHQTCESFAVLGRSCTMQDPATRPSIKEVFQSLEDMIEGLLRRLAINGGGSPVIHTQSSSATPVGTCSYLPESSTTLAGTTALLSGLPPTPMAAPKAP
ncbi:hypothetical protein CEUSTIGMA_g5311.t1 [Chlamydomonas eustigma]|uniref:Protein kinase domain-containing protein n=1 Tax=Chlamydomonas eustigma TaxID=1157962 RepID=A0A250X4M4_9CHLO|nr:hypothetical protein CEUSTIGMA_g5311.t1 [Chlamydomonas eustigma]|eukprot:GAX77869.1 hypothetical protein CEUSTIGMA_g5311.t1 [Chlamydomonas eustigma]